MYLPYRGITVGRDPHASKVVGVDSVFYELASSVLMHINSSGLAMVDLAFDDRRVRTGLYLKTGYPVIVDVVGFKVALQSNSEMLYRHQSSPIEQCRNVVQTSKILSNFLLFTDTSTAI